MALSKLASKPPSLPDRDYFNNDTECSKYHPPFPLPAYFNSVGGIYDMKDLMKWMKWNNWHEEMIEMGEMDKMNEMDGMNGMNRKSWMNEMN